MVQTDDRLSDDNDGQPALVGIQVDVDDLASFRSFLHRELTQNLSPAAQSVIREHSLGPGFGYNSVSMQVQATQDQYATALKISTLNMAKYVHLAEALISAMQDVMSSYRDSDLKAKDLTDKINERLTAVNLRDDPSNPKGMSW
jgi:hypothetical protein